MGNNQSYNRKTTAFEAANNIDLTGRTCLVTGSSSGIGIETARVLALHGCKTYMACRTQSKAEKVRDEIVQDILKVNKDFDADSMLKILSLDLASLESVHDCAQSFLSLNEPLHYLINNAGIIASSEYEESSNGYELMFATNHLGHFYLTLLLTPLILQSQPSRVINVSSVAPMFFSESYKETALDGIERKDGPLKSKYGQWSSYGFSKGCNILFAREMNMRYFDQGITSVSLHPGWINTSLFGNMKNYEKKLNTAGSSLFGKTVVQGAATTVRCVSMIDSEIKGGHYYDNCQENNAGLPNNLQLKVKTNDNNNNEIGDESEDKGGSQIWQWSELLITEKGYPLVCSSDNNSNVNVNDINMNSRQDAAVEQEEQKAV